MKELLFPLIAHMRWADVVVADALVAHPNTEGARLFAHVAAVEHLWLCRIEGRTARHSVWPTLTPSESRQLAAEHAELFERLVQISNDAQLARIVAYRNSAGKDFTNSVSDIVVHTAMHGEHHRGQIARVLRAAGHEPPYTDYIQFARRNQ